MPKSTPRRVLGALLLSLAACRPKEDPNVVRLNGRLEAPSVDLAPKVAGRVAEVKVKEGDRVKAGDLLVRLDLGETSLAVTRDAEAVKAAQARVSDLEVGSRQAEIQAAEADVADKRAALDGARHAYGRIRTLLAKKVVAPSDMDRATTELRRAEAGLEASEKRLALVREGARRFQTEQAKAELSRAETVLGQSQTVARESEVRAPADGVVLHRIAEPGLLLGPGQSALTLAFGDRLYVRTFVPETRLGKVRPGVAASVTVDAYPGRAFPAHVTEVSPDAEFTPKNVETREERVNLVYAAKVDLDAGWKEALFPGQPAEVTVRVAP
jgi:HlyD family secretion protein